MSLHRIVLIESRNFFILIWIRRTPGIHLRPEKYIKTNLLYLGLKKSHRRLHNLSLDHRTQACIREVIIVDSGITLINESSRIALEKFSQNLIIYSTPQDGSDGFHYYTPRTEFYVDKMISPEYFKDRFMDTFGPVAYILEHCGIYSSVFLFLKLIIDFIVMIKGTWKSTE